jgi:hypothetical protein
MENKENISRRDALKRMSKTALIVAVASLFPSANALANDSITYDKYYNYDNYSNYGNYTDYTNYDNYQNYDNYSNYRDYTDCH